MVATKVVKNNLDRGVPALKFKRTKIIATVGPATYTPQKIEQLIKSGTNGIRINFSHGSHKEHLNVIQWARQAAEKLDRVVAIIQDLQGPKLRVGKLPEAGINLIVGAKVKLAHGQDYKNQIIPTQHDFAGKIKPGETIFLNDGRIRLKTTKVSGKVIEANVQAGGKLLSNKGINLPDTNMGGEILTDKDLTDLKFGFKQDFDYVAVSFVQTARDVQKVKDYLSKNGSEAKIIAKIETKAALHNIEEIIKASDGVMIARGDLAVEAGLEVVPIIQRKIIGLARQHGTLVITATQMLMSMVELPQPSRADVSDVATAVIIGTDAVMLSEETTVGKFPLETVKTMKRIILYAEQNSPVEPIFLNLDDSSTDRSLASASITLAHQLKAKLILAETISGRNGRIIAAQRPQMPIIMPTNNQRVANQLAIVYGSKPFYFRRRFNLGQQAIDRLKQAGNLRRGDYAVLTYGKQAGAISGANTLRILYIE